MKQPDNRTRNRRSIRLKEYDYSRAGYYYITICTHNREHLFGNIEHGTMRHNDSGTIALNEWTRTPEMRPNISLDAFVIMPNHLHGIIIINGVIGDDSRNGDSFLRTGTMHRAPMENPVYEQFGKPTSNTIPTIIRGFKAAVTKQVNIIRKTPGVPVWQRNYYEHIIKDEKSYYAITEYIKKNPFRWEEDDYYDR
jgi:REP element-mobilizing transposase RayT